MPSHRVGWLVSLSLALVTARAAAFTGSRPNDGAVPLPEGSTVRMGDPARQAELGRSAAWRDFQARHGHWGAEWNEITGTPHRAVGPAIALPGFVGDADGVDRAVRRFIAGTPGVFGAGLSLETAAVVRAGNVWHVRYRQIVGGVPVLFEDWEFDVGTNGNLMAFGADAHRIGPEVVTKPLLVPAAAREAARSGLRFDPATDRVEGGDALYLLPYATEDSMRYRLAYDVRVHTADPPGNWIALVDARTGEVLWRMNRVRDAIGGNVSGTVHLALPTDPLTSRPFAHDNVTVGTTTVASDAAGNYSVATPGNGKVSAKLSGPFVRVDRGGGNASFTTNATDGSTVNIAWAASGSAASLDAERDAFYHVNLVHDYAKTLDPGFVGNDYQILCRVEVSGTCNAYWDGTLNFYAAGGGCPDIATIPDVIYHEYGHSINDNLYLQTGSPIGMQNGALHEGMADVNSAFVRDDPVIGHGFMGPGTMLRTIANTNRWPEDASGDPHTTGLIIGGAFWDLRQAVGLSIAEHLAHFAKYSTPDDPNDGVAMGEYFIATLVADDDDADLGNGTPHSGAIVAAFNAHGIGTTFFIDISHAPLADQSSGGAIDVSALISYSGSFGGLDTGSPTLHYSSNGAPYATVSMTPTTTANEYRATITTQAPQIVRYYISANDLSGGTKVDPPGAPSKVNVFLVGPPIRQLSYDFETAQGWTVGDPSDNATTGVWVREEPVGTYVGGIPVQPEVDHTPDPASMCFVTGNAAASDPPGTNDVDGGHTTLYSTDFSAAGLSRPVIEYYRWYSNNAGGAPGTDFWRVEITNDNGANWVPVENTNDSDNSWRRVLFFISDYVAPTGNMKLRFVAEDIGDPSLIEAAVDDFRLLSFPPTLAVSDGPRSRHLELRAPTPNPFRGSTRLDYALPARSAVALDVFDPNGRLVRSVERGVREAGEHRVTWDGRDRAGQAVGSGIYFARLSVEGRDTTRLLVKVR